MGAADTFSLGALVVLLSKQQELTMPPTVPETSSAEQSSDVLKSSQDSHDIQRCTAFPTLMEIKAAIPSHCFRASIPLSMYYCVRAYAVVFALGFAAHYLVEPVQNDSFRYLGWALYCYLQGTVLWGIFVLGHECGHGSFSRNNTLNLVMGNILHSTVLTPFESWKLSHRKHHKNTGNIDKDEIFMPYRVGKDDYFSRSLVATLPIVWFLYLLGAPPGSDSKNVRHFKPSDPLFAGHEGRVLISVVSWHIMMAGVCLSAYKWGVATVVLYYIIPLFVFAGWLVLTTFLHHNDEETPWYGDEEWTYVKGNLSSVDRSYFPFDDIIHNIGTHQIHHLFPIIPHYHLLEATEHFRKAYPHLVRTNNERVIPAFFKHWYNFYLHGYTDDDKQQYFTYRSAKKARALKSQ